MIAERNYRSCALLHPLFTANQWQELENQVLTFKYIMSGVPVPHRLISTVITSTPSNSSSLFPHQQQLPFGLGSFQVGYGYGYGYGYGRKLDLEPGRCRRTDGKKWRCSKEAHLDSKYCEKHMRRSKAKAKKQVDTLNNTLTTKAVTDSYRNTVTPPPATPKSCLPYPAISYSPVSHSSYPNPNKFQANSTTFYPFLPAQPSSNVSLSTWDDNTSPHWLGFDGEFHDQPNGGDIRNSDQQMKRSLEERNLGSEASTEEKQGGGDQEHDSQKLYHHFLGDWPLKTKTSHALGLFSTSN